METPQLTRVDGVEQAAGQPTQVVAPVGSGRLADAVAVARREAWLLPVLRRRRPPRQPPDTWEGVLLRLQAALWEVAARADVPVRPGASADVVARLLVGYGAVIPPAGDAVRALALVADGGSRDHRPVAGMTVAGMTVDEGARLAERLAGYLALRARFG